MVWGNFKKPCPLRLLEVLGIQTAKYTTIIAIFCHFRIMLQSLQDSAKEAMMLNKIVYKAFRTF